MNISNVIIQMIYFCITSLIFYFLLPKLKLKSLEWVAETSKRRIISVIISIILSGLIAGIISYINLEYLNRFTFVPAAIFMSIYNRIFQLAELKDKY
ncbi:hypothetical protein [Clostridium sp. C8]|uniref:hypothetical protein n=1 Tax=Clostridium sp. C8 TaxID=1667357 RepID=UPI00062E6204|nr:hypothetical protein [Clostridium sp. C8]KLE17102.1 hypothetical protein AAT22_01835 [Clostridium sp. C8]